MKHLISNDASKARVAKWLMEAKTVQQQPTWIERRIAIEFGGHTYLVDKEQVFQCAHCGHYDPKWNVTEVLNFFTENFGDAKVVEVEVTCTVAIVEKSDV